MYLFTSEFLEAFTRKRENRGGVSTFSQTKLLKSFLDFVKVLYS